MGIVCGIGIYERGEYVAWENGKYTSAYSVWANMINRCYCPENNARKWYSEAGVSVCQEWLTFQNFAKWHYQSSNYSEGWKLDKDLTIIGNKVYGPESCQYIPDYVNKLLNTHPNISRKYPQGVSYKKQTRRYSASISLYGKIKHLGYFDTVVEAQLTYLRAKSAYIKGVAREAYYKGEISEVIHDNLCIIGEAYIQEAHKLVDPLISS